MIWISMLCSAKIPINKVYPLNDDQFRHCKKILDRLSLNIFRPFDTIRFSLGSWDGPKDDRNILRVGLAGLPAD